MRARAQNFNTTRHDYEITLEPSSVLQKVEEDDGIPRIQYDVRSPLWPQGSLAGSACLAQTGCLTFHPCDLDGNSPACVEAGERTLPVPKKQWVGPGSGALVLSVHFLGTHSCP